MYKDKEIKKDFKGKGVQDKEVLLFKPYKESTRLDTIKSSFIHKEINNLEKHMKFIQSPTKTRIFNLLPHYKSIQAKGKQDSQFWQEVVVVFVDKKYNIETSCNRCPISMYQEGPSHEPYFIAINNHGQTIIGPNKKIVVTYVVDELEVLV